MNEWKELDPRNLPSDLLVPGAWDIEERYRGTGTWDDHDGSILLPIGIAIQLYDYRIRRPAGWEPSECSDGNEYLDIRARLADIIEIDEAQITPDSLLQQDLGIDSLDAYEIAYMLYSDFGITVPDDYMYNLETVQDFVSKYLQPKTTKTPTHEEIMTKWWKTNKGAWFRVVAFEPGSSRPYQYLACEQTFYQKVEWFIGAESADIPPCSK